MSTKPISRRQFLHRAATGSASLVAWGACAHLFSSSAHAVTGSGTKLLIINMNGGWDGLQIVQPMAGSAYDTLAAKRPTLRTDPAQLLTLNGSLGLHPSLTALKAIFDEQHLFVAHKVGHKNMSRSHKDAENAFARGVLDRLDSASSGYINRVGAEYGWQSLQAVSVAGADPAFQGGAYTGVQVTSLSSYSLSNDNSTTNSESTFRESMLYSVSQAWPNEDLKPRQQEVAGSISLITNSSAAIQSAVAGAAYPSAYPNTQLGRQLKDAEVLFSTPSLGTEVAYVRRGGFDTHSNQATYLVPLLSEFNAAISVFISNMKARGLWNDIVVVVMSEFGRTTIENGSFGTDHGGALPILVFGGQVRQSVVGEITSSDLTSSGWLSMTFSMVDIYRQIFAKMGYDPNRIFGVPSEPSVGAIL